MGRERCVGSLEAMDYSDDQLMGVEGGDISLLDSNTSLHLVHMTYLVSPLRTRYSAAESHALVSGFLLAKTMSTTSKIAMPLLMPCMELMNVNPSGGMRFHC